MFGEYVARITALARSIIRLHSQGFTTEFEKRSPLCTSCETIGYTSPEMLVCGRDLDPQEHDPNLCRGCH